MKDLKEFLTAQGFARVKLKKINTDHVEIRAKLNGVKGRFILDTGASKTCIAIDDKELFGLSTESSNHKASGAGPTELETLLSKENKLEIGKFRLSVKDLILIDLQHINKALTQQGAEAVQGIIGADVLHQGEAIIDYGKKYLFLKMRKK